MRRSLDARAREPRRDEPSSDPVRSDRVRDAARLLLSLLVALLAPLAGGCGDGEARELAVDASFTPDPPVTGASEIRLEVAAPEGAALAEGPLRIEANMSHAGMVPVFAEATRISPGRYRAELEFTMAGDWFLIVTATTRDGRTLEGTVDVPGVTPRGGAE